MSSESLGSSGLYQENGATQNKPQPLPLRQGRDESKLHFPPILQAKPDKRGNQFRLLVTESNQDIL